MANKMEVTDILNCLSNLSSDEVFTSPELVNNILDNLPQELFCSKKTTFLDPCSKSGVFLREIAKRLIKGLEKEIPDLQERIDWIFKKQIFGIPLTELTYHMTKRTLYCTTHAAGKYSITTAFKNNDSGNICSRIGKHIFKKGKCIKCGFVETEANKRNEKHAYYFIHCKKPEEIFNMKFDVIVGNPPYQLDDGGAQASAKPIYQLFVNAAKKLNPRYISMIIPSRWMAGGKGLDDFRYETLHDKHFTVLHDFLDASECFAGVEIKGGVCYFLWERDNERKCNIYTHDNGKVFHSERYMCEENDDVFIRFEQLISIKNKVLNKNSKTFSNIVSARKPYMLTGDFLKDPSKYGYPKVFDNPVKDGYKILGLINLKRTTKYIPHNYPLEKTDGLNSYKLFISESYGSGIIGEKPAPHIIGEPGELCTETFLQVGPFKTKKEAENCLSYMNTNFFRIMVSMRKNTQHATQKVYKYVPLVDFSKPWNDKELYSKYNLTKEEIDFIEKHCNEEE